MLLLFRLENVYKSPWLLDNNFRTQGSRFAGGKHLEGTNNTNVTYAIFLCKIIYMLKIRRITPDFDNADGWLN